MNQSSTIRLALLGAGRFARDAHIPHLLTLADRFEIVTVYSRTAASAERLNALLPQRAKVTQDIDEILADPSIDAVDIILPIAQLPAAVAAALRAGKHVISEKPLAPTVARGRELLALADTVPDQVWLLAENFRYATALHQAKAWLDAGAIGQTLLADWIIHVPMLPGHRYYETAWRRDNSFPGGYLLDGGIHQMAVLRHLFGEIAGVTAQMAQVRPDLPPADTLAATFRFASGLLATLAITYAGSAPEPTTLNIVGTAGAIQMGMDSVTLRRGEDSETHTYGHAERGILAELRDFADAVTTGTSRRGGLVEALRDVAAMEALFAAAATGRLTSPALIDSAPDYHQR